MRLHVGSEPRRLVKKMLFHLVFPFLAGLTSSNRLSPRAGTSILLVSPRELKLRIRTQTRFFVFSNVASDLKFQKRSQLFISTHNEALTVAAMCVCDPNCSPVGINR